MPDLADLPCLWLTTLRRDGSPHTTPVWFVLRDATVWVASSTVNVKVGNLQRDPRVSLAFDGTSGSPAVAEGTAGVLHLDGGAEQRSVLDALALKYDGWDAADPAQDGQRVLVRVTVSRWLLDPGRSSHTPPRRADEPSA